MEIFFIVLSVIVGLFVLFYLTIFAFAFYVHRRFFHRRYNGNKYLKYFKADDFYGLKTETISFQSDVGQYIHGYIYSYDQVKKPYGLIIFSHGFGAGHEAYTTEINTFAKAGFYVLAYDGTGCVGSEGKYFRGFDQGPIDLMSAYRFAESDPRLKDLRKIFCRAFLGGLFCYECSIKGKCLRSGSDVWLCFQRRNSCPNCYSSLPSFKKNFFRYFALTESV